ncbi:IS66 family insertion sequence element accessory protein TnpA, partial [Subdoligranulum variabile]|uniref:IS66 family insertion sequence element accessory protein TnpA n=1 Tax=Subdoligranulum variabile TaxID=214851 RepID=UPI0029433353
QSSANHVFLFLRNLFYLIEMGDVLQIRDGYRLQQWTQIIQQCKSSGLTNKAFCAQNGISEKTYYYWLKKMRTALAEKEAPHIIRLEDTPTDEPEDMIHIRFRSANMTLPAGTNVQAIAAVLQSLQQL